MVNYNYGDREGARYFLVANGLVVSQMSNEYRTGAVATAVT